MKRINLMLEKKDNTKAMKKAYKDLGIKSFSSLVRYLLKKFIGE